MKFDIKKMGMAFVGGGIAQIAANKYEDYLIKNGKEVKQKQTPLMIAGLASLIHYAGKGKMDALAMGMMGAAGADLGVQLYEEATTDEGDGATNGTPSQLSPQLQGYRDRALEIARQRRGIPGGGTPSHRNIREMKGGSGGDRPGRVSFYRNPYNNSRVA